MRDSAIIPRWLTAAILDFIEPVIAPFDAPTPTRTKHGVDQMHRLQDIRL